MADRLRITELDFDQIKTNLKSFLKQQSQFSDYDFEGSGLSVLIDLLAYNTHYNAYYLNMVANEAFLDTAILRDSVVSHAKTLGYRPYSYSAAVATVTITVDTNNSTPETLTLPKGYTMLSNLVDGTSYTFVTLEPYVATKSGTTFVFENVKIYEGQLIGYTYAYDQTENPKSIFTIPDAQVDTSTITVTVKQNASNTNSTVYTLAEDILDVTGTSEVYFLQESRDGRFQIYFGDDAVGKKLPDGAVVTATYLVTNGDAANKSKDFVGTVNVGTYSNYQVDTIIPAAGGKVRESVDEIRKSALAQYSTQNRLVTYKDYQSYVLTKYPNIDAISVWGGEEETPKAYGKVFISMKPKKDYYLSENEKENILNNIVVPKSIVAVQPEIRDPEYLYLMINATVQYDPRKTLLDKQALKNSLRTNAILYRDEQLDTFGSTFSTSDILQKINKTDNSIVGSGVRVRVQKRFEPSLLLAKTYTLNFNVALHRGTLINKLSSNEFGLYDALGVLRTAQIEESPQAFTGITEIQVTNSGFGYTTPPTITISGDGTGAEAYAVLVNGRVQSIKIVNRGIDYSRALVTITGGNGTGATAVAVLDAKYGKLRTVYYDAQSKKQIINESAGTINYDSGEVIITDLRVISVDAPDGIIRIDVEADKDIIKTTKNTIITIDEDDTSSFSAEILEV